MNIEKWVTTAVPGDSIVYGRATFDTPVSGRQLAVARRLYDAGLVELVQKRRPGGALDYIAQRKTPLEPAEERRRAAMQSDRSYHRANSRV